MQTFDAGIRKYEKAKVWRHKYAEILFPTDGSFDWFTRTHRNELIESGALIVRSGRAGNLVDTDRIGPVIQQILQQESLKKIDTTAAA